MRRTLNKRILEALIEQEVLLKSEEGDFYVVFGKDGARFKRYVNYGGRRICETLQEVDNTIRANRKKREVVWREEPPSYDSGYKEFVVHY